MHLWILIVSLLTPLPGEHPATDSTVTALCEQWNILYAEMQYGSVDRRAAGKLLRQITNAIAERVSVPHDSNFYFPLEGCDLWDVGGKNGDDFVPRSYNFLHGNAHRGHPAHDIFINDVNQNCLDDDSGKPVHVLAMTDGIVLARKTDWVKSDSLRGGNYLMIFNPYWRRYYYYAHNNEILVQVGEVVRAGQQIATVGRTGRNAWRKRSPTHLHLMVLELTDEKGEPINYYDELRTAIKTRPH